MYLSDLLQDMLYVDIGVARTASGNGAKSPTPAGDGKPWLCDEQATNDLS
jgi:hypothetical protein